MPQISFAYQWTIEKNQLLPLKGSLNGKLFSTSVSNIAEFEYYLSIYPNGYSDGSRGQTSIGLHLEFKNFKEVKVEYTFIIESANYSRTFHQIYEKSGARGISICGTDVFFDPKKKFFVDGKFTVNINGIFKFENEDDVILVNIDAGQQKWMGGELGEELWMKDGTKDFKIITADGKEINVHKVVLENRSDVFTAMLNSNMKESIENKVTIPNFPFIVVETAFKIIYNCSFTTQLSMEELMSLLQFFDQYQLLALKVKVEPHLIAQISASTVCRLTNCSIFTNSTKLKLKCMDFFSTAFASKTPLDDIDDLDKDILLQIVKNNFYQILQTET